MDEKVGVRKKVDVGWGELGSGEKKSGGGGLLYIQEGRQRGVVAT